MLEIDQKVSQASHEEDEALNRFNHVTEEFKSLMDEIISKKKFNEIVTKERVRNT